MRGRDKLIGCARKWELGRAGLEFQLPFYDIPSMAAERRDFASLCSPRGMTAFQPPEPFGSGSPEAAVDKRMKQAKGPCCATTAVESGYAGDWRGFAASSRSAYAHASALAHSRGHVFEGAAGTGAGSGEHERWE